ncbi:hypothetical protein [Desulfoferrobacter suflitae]|uniref:hypothetical protein n=1 Tax=Desulfoferrobacter suflitae TaxID=2865782 RepID=UPI00216434F5|nr:hypothetical protein [Desulfoferrobacter suflitae]MCK8603309.1 hypothetical protein [Desulfoferrobacter suflitae]
MKSIEISTASKPLSEYVDELGDEVLVLTSHQQPIAAIVSLKNVDKESLSLSTNAEFMAIIEKARDELKSGRKISFEDMRKEVLQ